MKDLSKILPSFQRSQDRGKTSRTTGNSSKKFDPGKWLKLSTGCEIFKRNVVCDTDDCTLSITTVNTSQSSETPSCDKSQEIGYDVLDNGLLFSRYNSGYQTSPAESQTSKKIPKHAIDVQDIRSTKEHNNSSKDTINYNDKDNRKISLNFSHGKENNILKNTSLPPLGSPKHHPNPFNSFPQAAIDSRGNRNFSSLQSSEKNGASMQPFLKPRKKREVWRPATDPKTGNVYYYEEYSRKTQWHKPLDLASDLERLAIQKKEKRQREFFSSMEANIIRCMQNGVVPGSPGDKQIQEDKVHPLKKPSLVKKDLAKPALIKTISSMDAELLVELTKEQRDEDNKKSMPRLSPDSVVIGNNLDFCVRGRGELTLKELNSSSSSFDISDEIAKRRNVNRYDNEVQEVATSACRGSEGLLQDYASHSSQNAINHNNMSSTSNHTSTSSMNCIQPVPKPSLDRRNTCGTLYVKSTMAAPDKDATIKCVCGVYRAHLLQAVSNNHNSKKIKFPEYEVFNDSPLERCGEPSPSISERTYRAENDLGSRTHTIGSTIIKESADEIEMSTVIDDQTVPSLEEITDFYRFVFNKAQMESDCIIVSLIYVERILRDTNGGVWPNPKNWRSLLFSCMVMASKVWDDLSMWNKDFAHVCPSGIKFSLKRINELELALLNCLNFDVKVPASVYAKYYFLMRSMLLRSGLAGDELLTMEPLTNEGAKRLEFVTANYKPLPKPERVSQRAKSMGETVSGSNSGTVKEGEINQLSWRISKQVNLEQVVNM